MACPNCRAEVAGSPFCPQCGYRLDDQAEYPPQQHDSHGKPDASARRQNLVRHWAFPLLVLFVVIAFGVLALALIGFRDGQMEHELATRHAAAIHYNRGKVYLDVGWYQMAEAEFDEALRLVPGYTQAQEGQRIAQLEQTVTPSPTPSPSPPPTTTPLVPTPTPEVVVIPVTEVLFKEGTAHYENAEWEQAILKLEQLRLEDITYQPERVNEMLFQSYYHYGMELDDQDMVEAAIAQYSRALSLRPRHPEVEPLRRRADLYQSALDVWNVDWETAVNYLSALYELASDYKDAADRLYQASTIYAQMLIKQDRYCSAAKLYEQAIEIRDGEPDIVKLAEDTRHLCQFTTPAPTQTPPSDQMPYVEGKVHLGTLVATCYDSLTHRYDLCAQDAESDVSSTWIAQAEQPALSLDGSLLAYRSTDPERPGLYAIRIVSTTIPITESTTVSESLTASSTVTTVTLLTITAESEAHYPTWSPDGTRVAYTQYDEAQEDWFIYIAQIGSTTPPQRIRKGEWPNWGSHGLLALTTCGGENDCGIHIYDPTRGRLRRVTASRQDRAAAWSPSGDEIAYLSDIGLSTNLYVAHVTAESATVRQITRNLFIDVMPAWSPDGQRIAYITNHDDDWAIYTIHPQGGQEKRIGTLGAESADWQRLRLAWAAQIIPPLGPVLEGQ